MRHKLVVLGLCVASIFVAQAALASIANANPCRDTTNPDKCTVSGQKFDDLNMNGVKDVGELGLKDWKIYADYDDDGVLDPGEPFAVTDVNGNYKIVGINCPISPINVCGFGQETDIRELYQAGWTCSKPSTTDTHGCLYHDLQFEGTGASINRTGIDFGNWKKGRITVVKETDPAGSDQAFGFTSSIVGFPPSPLTDEGSASKDVNPGTYTVTELGVTGWTLTLITCKSDDPADTSSGNVGQSKATYIVKSDENITCTFHNTKFTNTQPPPPPSPPLTTVAGGQQKGVSASASLGAPSGCVGKNFRVSVRGTGISKVTFYLDGKKIKTVKKPSHGLYSVTIKRGKLHLGAHRVKAKVKFVGSTATPSRTLTRTVQRCRAGQPKFTG